MKAKAILLLLSAALFVFVLFSCEGNASPTPKIARTSVDSTSSQYEGYPNQIAYGHHLVMIAGCNDCHTPKKMTPFGPVPDTTLALSGHPSAASSPDVDPKEIEKKGLAVTNDMTAWVGPWGTSFAANLTPDATGIGNWTEAQFMRALREGKFKGLEGSRPLLPPMPWQDLALMNDAQIKAMFAYLKSIKPIHNVVPPPVAPVLKHH